MDGEFSRCAIAPPLEVSKLVPYACLAANPASCWAGFRPTGLPWPSLLPPANMFSVALGLIPGPRGLFQDSFRACSGHHQAQAGEDGALRLSRLRPGYVLPSRT